MTNKETVTPEAYESPVIEDIASVSILKGQETGGGTDQFDPNEPDEM